MPTNIKESKKLNKQVIYMATFIIYILAFLVFELGYCNATNIAKLVSADFSNIKYNFSLCRIVMYIIFIITLFIVKGKFVNEAIEASTKKYKRILIYTYFTIAIITIIGAIFIIAKNPLLARGMSIGIIGALMGAIAIIYISNNTLKNFIIITFSIGAVYTMATDFNHALDEKKHFMSAFNIAFGNFDYSKNPITDEKLNTIPHFSKFVFIDEYLSEKYTPNITHDVNKEDVPSTPADYNFITYIFPAFGIFIAKTLGGSIIDLYIMGRLCNLILYCILVSIAIKLIPYKKNILMTIALMPMALLLASTFSIDGFCIGVLFVFIAYCLKLKKEKETITIKDFAILVALFGITLLAKTMAYILIALIFFMLPIKNTLKKNKKYVPIIIVVAIICVIVLATLVIYIKNNRLGEDTRAVGDVSISEQLNNLIHNPVFDVKLVLEHTKNTFFNFNWWMQLHSTAFFTVNAQALLIPIFLFILYVALTEDDYNFNIKDRTILILSFLGIFFMTSMVLYITFTKVGALYIDGYQTRYILPILPLILFCISNNKVINKNKENRNINIAIITGIFILLGLIQNILG